jgi:hypothetical protein
LVVTSVPQLEVRVKERKVDFSLRGETMEGFERLGPEAIKELPSESVDEVRAVNVLEYFDGPEQVAWMNELHRVLKTGKGATIIIPFGFSVEAFKDPFVKSRLVADSFWIYDKAWREENKVVGGRYDTIQANFNISFPSSNVDQAMMTRSHEAQQWMSRFMINTVHGLVVLLIKR